MGNSFRQLTLMQRYQIEAFKELNFSARMISKKLKCSNKTISNELKRCALGKYCAEKADNNAIKKRKSAPKAHKRTSKVIEATRLLLKLKLSPEQISGRMLVESFYEPVSRQTIYRIATQEGWKKSLPRKGKRYRQQKGIEAGARLIPNRTDIDERPACVDLKEDIGHWEGDTVYGQDGYLVTLTERVSKMLLTVRVKNKTKKLVTRAINKMLKPYNSICKTITFDNGGEFAGHESIARALNCKVYFAKPYHSWQRGLNENTNGLLRRFFSKGMAIGGLSIKEIAAAQLSINMRPRKALNYVSPIEFLSGRRVSLIVGI
jgi:IS30 family transposase